MIEIYRKHIKAQEHHFRTDPDIQAERQRKAVEAHLARLAEEEARLPIIIKESEPISQEPLLRSRLKPIPPQKPKQRVSRAQQKEKTNERPITSSGRCRNRTNRQR